MEQERARQIQTMFSRITRRYDLMNRVMTGGRDQAWRRMAARELRLGAGGLVLDLATGTGDLAFAVREAYPDARVVAMDFSETILREGVRKARVRDEQRVAWGVGDALALPFPDATFDGCTNAFLIRNVVDLPLCLREMKRVVKPGGRVIVPTFCHDETALSWVVSRALAVTGFPGHRRFTTKSLRRAVEDSGVRVNRTETLPGVIPIGYVEGTS